MAERKEENIPLNFLGYFFIGLIAFMLFFILQTANKTLLCPDSFYHAKIASFLAEGKLIKNFPWLPYTILSHSYIDHHFLYHFSLIPFVKLFEPLEGIKIATLFFATLTIIVFYWFLKKFKIKLPFLWTFLLLTSSVFLTRLNLAKVPAAALPILLFGLYALFKRKYILLIVISFIYVWLYNTWPILLVAVIIYCLANALKKTIDDWPKIFLNSKHQGPNFKQSQISNNQSLKHLKFRIWNLFGILGLFFTKENICLVLSCLLGIICGLILNPYFPQNLYFDWIHIVQIGLKNYQNILPVGVEWYPYEPATFIFDNLLIFLPWLIALSWFVFSFKKKDNQLFKDQPLETWALFFLSVLFFIYTVKSRRNVDYSIPLTVLFSAFSLNNLLINLPWRSYFDEFKKLQKNFSFNLITAILGLSVLILAVFSLFSLSKNIWLAKKQEFAGGANFNKFEGVAKFLKENTKAGEIIFHSSWDEFPALFYHNDQNVYIAGLDPTFSYVENKPLYWLWQNIVTTKQKNNLARTLKQNFQSNYILIKADYKELKKSLEESGDFKKIYEDKDALLYKIK